jgi:hypothetical protein
MPAVNDRLAPRDTHNWGNRPPAMTCGNGIPGKPWGYPLQASAVVALVVAARAAEQTVAGQTVAGQTVAGQTVAGQTVVVSVAMRHSPAPPARCWASG